MKALPGVSLYNQDRLSDDDFLLGFIARADLVEFLARKLWQLAQRDIADHQLIIGSRGMGKTSLLRRVAIAIRRDADLRDRYIPLRFREEQYNVLSLDGFWRNCAESLAEWCEDNGKEEVAQRLDRCSTRAEWRDPAVVAEAFLSETKALGGRAVLLVDNLDLIIDALSEDEHWALRRTLQAPGGPVIIGAATDFPRQSGDQKAAFYEFFHAHFLEALTIDELRQCMRGLAEARGDIGRPVLDILAREPERLETLHRLTGGNPRVLALIYRLLERAESDTVFADLEILLDQVTPYYKARVEEYQTKLQRAVIDAIALNWDPITSRAICEATATEATTISPQLIRLRNDGLIEEVPTSGSRSGYQLVERFFNIWYLMRHGTRRTRQKLSWLAKFLASFYRPDELRLIAAEAAIESSAKRWHPMYREALAEAIDSISGAARFGFKGVEEAISPEDLSFMTEIELRRAIEADPANLSAREELAFRLAVQLNRPEEAIAILDEIVARYGDAAEPPLREHVARALFNKGFTLGSLGRSEEAIAVYNALEARYGDAAELPLRVRVARALVNKGITLGSLGRSEEAIAVYDGLEARYGDAAELPLRVRVARALFSKGLTFASLGRSEEAIAVYDGLVTRFGKLAEPPIREIVEKALLQKGNIFADLLDRPGDAEVAYQDAMRISGDRSMSAKASLAWLCLTTQRLSEAEAFRARLETLPPNTLLDAGLEIGRDNFGAAAQILGSALAQSPDSGFDFSGDLPRLLRLIEARGYGEWLIGWFGETGHAERLAPVYAAFVAYVRGERFLLDVNPEVRAPARDIFDRLSAARRHQAAKKPIAGDKRRRGRPAKRR